MKVLNLDDFKVEINEIVLNGKNYKVPSQLPVDLMFELMNYTNETKPNSEAMLKAISTLHKAFQIHQPELKFDDFKNMMNLDYFTMLMNFIFAGIDASETKKMLDSAKNDVATAQKKISDASATISK